MEKDKKQPKGISPVVAGVAGAAIGAAATAAAIALSDKKTRQKIGKTFNDLKKEGLKQVDDLKGSLNEKVGSILDQADEATKSAQKTKKTITKKLKKK